MSRHLPFEKGINFRDLGGYATRDGRTIKWQKLFRCGHFGQMTDADLEHFADLGVAVVCDFRSAGEYEKMPSRKSPRATAAVHQLDIDPMVGNPFADNINNLASGAISESAFFDLQKETYRQFVTEFSDRYAAMFRLMDQAEGRPIVIHCTAGKDRTGFGASLILHALGVPEETIREDYLLSNQCRFMLSFARHIIGKGVASLDPALPENEKLAKMMVLLGANLDFLQVAYDTIRERSGSVERYLSEGLGVTEEKRARLRAWFLE